MAFSASAQYKPEPLTRYRNRKRRLKTVARARCRAVVYMKAEGCCEECGRPLVLKPSEARHEFEIAHVHEKRFRSLGGSAVDPTNGRTLCHRCHGKAHRL